MQSDARPLAAATQSANIQSSQSESKGAGVALRWVSVTKGPAPSNTTAANNSKGYESAASFPGNTLAKSNTSNGGLRVVQPAAAQSNGSSNRLVSNAGWTANPLRGDSGVRPANYQQQPESPANDPLGNDPAFPSDKPAFPPSDTPTQQPTQDPLSNFEPPPLPGGELVQPEQVEPSVAPEKDTGQEASPLDRSSNTESDPFGDKPKDDFDTADEKEGEDMLGEDKREDLKMPKRTKKGTKTTSCTDQRDRARQMRLTDISLDVSPEFGEGLLQKDSSAQKRLDFAASAPIRDWTDYTGTIVATGRLVDLRNDRAVLDVNGREQLIPMRDLSDIDIAYVSGAWNLPSVCGTGYESYAGRQFIPSAVEWKASGLCHKPLYFEDVQLERYGHEVGPVLQPLISSAHFFGNMLILPYKMGIHPPGECQYPLGYYRPGDCAPYMIQPFPFSLRGAAAQAGFVTGSAALIP